jgi:1-deoxy-D-xylulose-5-phosphate synthase
MSLLDTVTQPADLRPLTGDQLDLLAAEIRAFLVDAVCQHGGHLGPNLGAVELTIALHRVFHSPHDRIIFDTGHQAYVHKILTGRKDGFAGLRQYGGLSGYPSRAESQHDLVENSHASTALAYADGLCRAYALDGADRAVVAVIGDGALTGGLAWEALNNLAVSPGRAVIVLNDNTRSYAATVGGVAAHLAALRRGGPGSATGDPPDASHPGDLTTLDVFAALGLSYLGPVDGHDIAALEDTLNRARALGRPVVVHCVTGKGRGYPPAEADDADRLHAVGAVDPTTGRPAEPPGRTWTDAFADELVAIGETHPDVVALSAAMLGPTGLSSFARRFPARAVDVGIAEQHAITSAAGLAFGGKHPVVAIYATFLNRAFDQVLLDVALHRLPVTIVLDRAGITGPDGPSHHGIWDLAVLGAVPGLRLAAPRDETTLREELREAVSDEFGPTVLRFPKAGVGAALPALDRIAGVDVLRAPAAPRVLIVSIGAMAEAALPAAGLLAAAGLECTVVDPRWVRPVNPVLPVLAADHALVVTVEDGVRGGGIGTAIAQSLADAAVHTPVKVLGLPTSFIPHGGRQRLLIEHGLDPAGIAAAVLHQRGGLETPAVKSPTRTPISTRLAAAWG